VCSQFRRARWRALRYCNHLRNCLEIATVIALKEKILQRKESARSHTQRRRTGAEDHEPQLPLNWSSSEIDHLSFPQGCANQDESRFSATSDVIGPVYRFMVPESYFSTAKGKRPHKDLRKKEFAMVSGLTNSNRTGMRFRGKSTLHQETSARVEQRSRQSRRRFGTQRVRDMGNNPIK
jgi:hypothetical protein